jgi:4-oxalmesaconate hydratase
MTMIIDCHGHYTVLPKAHDAWREQQKAAFKAGEAAPPYPEISDDEIRETIEANQLRLIKERGADMTIFAPRQRHGPACRRPERGRALGAGVQQPDRPRRGALSGNLCRRVHAAPVARGGHDQLDRRAGTLRDGAGLHRLQPQPRSGRRALQASAADGRILVPFYEKMVELDVPAMIHVSGSCNPAMHATGAYYIAADSIAFMQLLEGDLFSRFPRCASSSRMAAARCPITGVAIAGLADMLKKPALDGHLMNNVFFDTCVYHQPGVNLLAEVIETKNILFGSEMVARCAASIPPPGTISTTPSAMSMRSTSRRAAPRDLRGQCPPRVPAPGRQAEGEGPVTIDKERRPRRRSTSTNIWPSSTIFPARASIPPRARARAITSTSSR